LHAETVFINYSQCNIRSTSSVRLWLHPPLETAKTDTSIHGCIGLRLFKWNIYWS